LNGVRNGIAQRDGSRMHRHKLSGPPGVRMGSITE
jgi:hypothetical protein